MSDARRAIDCEDLVRWACEQLPSSRLNRRAIPVGADPMPGVDRENKELVGRWTRPASFPQISPGFSRGYVHEVKTRTRTPPADALTVEAAIRALPRAARGIEPPAELAADIGLPVDIDAAWARARGMIVNLLLVHGRLGNRPCVGHTFAVSPRLAANGKPAVLKLEPIAEPGAFGAVDAQREARALDATFTRMAPIAGSNMSRGRKRSSMIEPNFSPGAPALICSPRRSTARLSALKSARRPARARFGSIQRPRKWPNARSRLGIKAGSTPASLSC